jgi:hypothetical protein
MDEMMSIFLQKNGELEYEGVRNEVNPAYKEAKELCMSLWSEYKKYADTSFTSQFASNFFERFWEMDLTVELLNRGFNIESANSGPDIKTTLNEQTMWIEATCPKRGNTDDKIKERPIESTINILDPDKIMLRQANAFDTKFKALIKYQEEDIIKDKEPFIIAINGSQLDQRVDARKYPFIAQMLFGISSLHGNLSLPAFIRNQLQLFLYRKGKKSIRIAYFLNRKYSDISAVIYTTRDPMNRAIDKNSETACYHYIVVHNPYASNHIPKSTFDFADNYSINPKSLEVEFTIGKY